MSRRAALAVALLALGGARAAPSEDGLPVIDVRAGVPIADLPGRDILLPPGPRAAFGVTLTPARVRVFIAPGDEEPAVSFATPVYRNDIDGHVYLFGPGARLRAPAALDVRVANDLTYAPGAAAAAAPAAHAMAPGQPDYSAYRDPLATNLHTHGLHASPGAGPQAGMAAAYRGGDNVFYEVRAGGSAPALEYTGEVGENHMPGLHWYHPHAHGSSTLQAGTANGLILVDDDDRWLPDDRGCGPLKAALAAAPAEVLLIDILAFATAAVQTKAYQDPNLQVIAARAAPAYPLCCGNSTSTGEGAAEGPLPLDPPGYNTTLALVNGGWQPVLGLVAGEWARWRALHAGWKMTLDLTLVDGAGAPAGCEMALVAKDGVFLLEAPRPVGGLLLNPGNRADVLVRCPAPGNFSLAAGAATSPFGTWSNWYGEFRQPVVAAVVVAPRAAGAPAAPALEAEACAPLRPSYAPDLRDAALKAAGVEPASRPMAFEAIEHNGLKYGCKINHDPFTFPDPDPLVMRLGTVTEWVFASIAFHPLHVHVNPFQIAALNESFLQPGASFSSWFRAGDYHDTLMLPMLGSYNYSTAVPLRWQPGELPGWTVAHCHFLMHEDTGCMAVVRYQCPNETDTGAGADDEPWTCPGFEFPIRGSWEQRYGEPKGAASELPAASSDAAGTPLPAATSSAAAGAPLPAVAWALAALALACSCALL